MKQLVRHAFIIILSSRGAYEEALSLYSKASDMIPLRLRPRYGIFRILCEQGRYDEANKNMKRIIFCMVYAMLFITNISVAQDYYSGKKYVSGGEISFEIYDEDLNGCIVENQDNTLRNQEQRFDNGEIYYRRYRDCMTTCLNDEIIDEIVRRNIPQSVLSRMKETKCCLFISAYVLPKTERASEISYWLFKLDRKSTNYSFAIPPSSLAAIERELKEKLVFKCSRKDVNFVKGNIYTTKASGNCASWYD